MIQDKERTFKVAWEHHMIQIKYRTFRVATIIVRH